MSIITTLLFLIAKSNLTNTFFLNLNKSLEQTQKYTKGFKQYSFICRCPGLINQCTFGFSKQLAGNFAPATELELNMFQPQPFGELVWHISTQVNDGDLASQITIFYPIRGKRRRFINFLLNTLVYPGIFSNLVTLDILSPWSGSVCTHTCSPLLRKPLLR